MIKLENKVEFINCKSISLTQKDIIQIETEEQFWKVAGIVPFIFVYENIWHNILTDAVFIYNPSKKKVKQQ